MEVIINPVNPPHNGDYIKLNDLLEEVEEHIPQIQEPAPEHNLLQEVNQNMQVIGFPLPALRDVLGEEIPMDEIIGHNNEIMNEAEQIDDDDLDLDMLVGPGEEGFPNLPNGGMQLPINHLEGELMDLADGVMQEQIPNVVEPPQPNQEPAPPLQDQDQIINNLQLVPAQQPQGNNQHMQVGMVMIQERQWDHLFNDHMQTRGKQAIEFCGLEQGKLSLGIFKKWGKQDAQGNIENIQFQLPANWLCFFNRMLLSVDNFEWAKKFLASGAPTLLADNDSMVPLSVPKAYTPPNTCFLSSDSAIESDTEEGQTAQPGATAELQIKSKEPSILIQEGSKKRKTKKTTPVVDSQVRRSERIRQGNNGFKNPTCSSKKCTSCNPPTLTNKIIRNVGVQFCSLEPEELVDEILEIKGNKKESESKKRSKKIDNHEESNKGKEGDSEQGGNGQAGP